MAYKIENIERGSDKRTAFEFKPTGRNNRNVEITQTFDVSYGWDLLGRYSGLYVARHVGDDMKLGLSRIVGMLASIPNEGLRRVRQQAGRLQVIDRPAEDVLFVTAGNIDRANTAIQSSIGANSEWIKRVMDANGLGRWVRCAS